MACVRSTEVVDLKGGVKGLRQQFSHLEFGAHHVLICGVGSFGSMEVCNNLDERCCGAGEGCDEYLEGRISLYGLVSGMQLLDFIGFLNRIRQYLTRDFTNFVVQLTPIVK